MLRYVENLLWRLNAAIPRYDIPPDAASLALTGVPNLFPGGGRAAVTAVSSGGAGIGAAGTPNALALTVDAEGLEALRGCFSRFPGWHLRRLVLLVLEAGFLNVQVTFELQDREQARDFERIGLEVSDVVMRLFAVFARLIHELAQRGLLSESELAPFGVPKVLGSAARLSPEDTYLFNQHLVILGEEPTFEAHLKKLFHLNGAPLRCDPFEVFMMWSLGFWFAQGPVDDERLEALIRMDNLCLSQSNLCASSVAAYTAILEELTSPATAVTSSIIRRLFNVNNATLQRLRLQERDLTEVQRAYLLAQKQQAGLESEIAFYRSAESTLKLAVEGMEAEWANHSSKVLQFILLLFTALTVYSVFTDVSGFLSDNKPLAWQLRSLRTSLFAVLSMLLAVVSFFAYGRLKRM